MKKMLFALLALVGMTHAAITATFSKKLSAVDSAITMSAGSYNSVSFQLDSTWSATVKFEGTVNGTKWITVYAVNQNGGAVDSVATANGVYLLSGNGFKLIRARVSARSSGTVKVQAYANEGSGVVSLLNQSSAGASSNVAVTSSALPTGAATATGQTGGSQKTQVVDGSGNIIGATSNALDVNIKSGASSGAVAQGSTTSGQTGGLTQAAVTTAAPTYTTGQTSPLSMDVNGNLRVNPGSVTVGSSALPTGAATEATLSAASGKLPATLGQKAMAASMGVVLASDQSSIPTAATLQAGSAVVGKVGIDQTTPGTTNGVQVNAALPAGANLMGKVGIDQTTPGTTNGVLVNGGNVASGASDAGNPVKVGGKYNATPPTLTDGQRGDAQLDANGYLKVNVAVGGGTGGTSSTFGSAFPATGTAAGFLNSAGTNMAAGNLDASGYLKVNVAAGGGAGGTSSSFGSATPATGTAAGFSDGTNMQAPRAFDADAGAGTQYVAGVSLRKAASGGSVEAGTSSDPLRFDPTGTTPQPVTASALPLPTGAATEATLSAASAKLPATLGQKAMTASMAVVLASDQASIPTAATMQAGSSIVGKMGIDQTTPGTTNGVQVNAALPAGTNILGKFGIDQTTPGTTNGVQVNAALPAGSNTIGNVNPGTAANWGTGATGSAAPANAQYAGANSSGNLTGLIQADGSVKIDVSTATTTQLVALSSTKKIYVTSWDVVAAGTGTIKLVYGTGSSCGTGTTDLTGAYSLVAQSGLAKGNGLGPVLVVPASNALCVTTSAAVGMQGSVAYTQF